MDKQKLIKQLFVGKVSDILGFEKTNELLKEATDAINAIDVGQKLPIHNVSVSLICETCVWYKTSNQAAPCPACFGKNKHVVNL